MKSNSAQRRAILATMTAILIALSGLPASGQTVLSGTYNGPSNNSGSYIINANTNATFTAGYTFQATTNLALANNATLYWNQNATLSGTAITSGTTSYGYLSVGTNDSLTLDSATTLTGEIYLSGTTGASIINQGAITQNNGYGYIYGPTLTNQGSITANTGSNLYVGYYNTGETTTNAVGGTITANGANIYLENIINLGTLTAQNGGAIYFEGTGRTTANLGNTQIGTGGGHLYFNGTLDNTSATLNAPGGSGAIYELYGGTINGGTIAAGALTFTSSNGTLNNVSYAGDMNLAANMSVTFTGGSTSFTGANLTLGNNATLDWNQNGTLTGKAITSGTTSNSYISVGTNNSLTLGSGTTLTGDLYLYGTTGATIINQGAISQNTGYGYIYAPTFTNQGSITANTGSNLYVGYYGGETITNASGGAITANNANVYLLNIINQGTLTAQNGGAIYFQGTGNTTANLGNTQIGTGGGHLYLAGTVDNTSATLNAPGGTGATYELYGGTINGGTIAAGALTFTSSNGTLNNVTYTGDLNLPANLSVTFTGGSTVFTGSNLTLGNNTTLDWNQNGTLTGKAITSGTTSNSYISVGTNNSLTLGSGTTLTGDVYLYGTTGATIINQGAISQNTGYGYLYAPTFTNQGSITANTGTNLNVGYYSGETITNASGGTITANGANANIDLLNIVNQGTITAQNGGAIYFQGTGNTTANLGNTQIGTGGGHLYLNGTIDNTSATLNAPGGTGATYELYGGTINSGTIAAGVLSFTSSNGYLNNVSYTGDFNLPANLSVTFTGGSTVFTGSNLTLGNNATLDWYQNGTLTGKTITSGTTSYGYIYVGTNNSLTLGSGTTLTGDVYLYGSTGATIVNQGSISQNTGYGYLYAPTFTNQGSITANSGTNLYVGYYGGEAITNASGGTITANNANVYLQSIMNQGTITAQNGGVINFQGAGNTTASLGNAQIGTGGGHLYLAGTVDNTSATLNAPGGTGATYELYGGTINNGTIAAGALTFTNYGGTIAGATLQASVTMPASTSVTLSNDSITGNINVGSNATLTLSGGTSVPNGVNINLGDFGTLNWNQNGTLTGNTITAGVTAGYYAPIYVGTNNSLTLGTGTLLSGDVYLYGYSGSTIINNGTISQNSGSGTVYAPTFTNNAAITANAGASLTVGYYYNTGTTNASAGTITASGANANVYLENIMNQGTLIAQNGGVLEFQGTTNPTANLGTPQIGTGGGHLYLNGTFDNTAATLNPPSGGSYELYGGTINNGTIAVGALSFSNYGGTLNNVSYSGDLSLPASSSLTMAGGTAFTGTNLALGDYANLYWNQNGTLTGKTITSGTTPGYYAPIYVGTNNSLTLGPGTTLTGDIYLTGSSGSSVINQGAITHTSGSGYLYVPSFTNAGLLDVQAGYLYTSGNNLTNVAGGTIRGTGTIGGNAAIAGGTISPGETTGNLTFYYSAFSVTGPSVMSVNLGGTTANELIFQSPNAPVNLGSGLLTLSLNLLSAPAPGTVYPIIGILSGTNGITGTFAGLPASGYGFSTTYLGTPYTFDVNYGTNLITITAVPEPGTTALVGLGLTLFGISRWWTRRIRS